MSLPILYNVFRDNIGLQQFSFSNNDEHVRINEAIFKQFNVNIPTYILDPIPLNETDVWLATHQQVHNYMDSVLGIVGNDLTDVDFKNPAQLTSWIWLHAQEHYQAAQILGIG